MLNRPILNILFKLSHGRFPVTSKATHGEGRSYRRWQADGGDSESMACGESGHAVSPEEGEVEEVEEVAEEEEVEKSRFPSSLETTVELKPWKRQTEKHAFNVLIWTVSAISQ